MRKLWNAVKWPLAVLCILVGAALLITAAMNLSKNTDLAAVSAGLGVVLLGESLFCIVHARKKRQAPPLPEFPASGAAVQASEKPRTASTFRHAAGLPLAEGVECRVESYASCLAVTAMNQVFTLADEKIRGASVMTRKEVQKQFVPRLIGIRRKTLRSYSRFLAISYGDRPDAPGKSIVFELGEWNVDKARQLAALYRDRPASHIEL